MPASHKLVSLWSLHLASPFSKSPNSRFLSVVTLSPGLDFQVSTYTKRQAGWVKEDTGCAHPTPSPWAAGKASSAVPALTPALSSPSLDPVSVCNQFNSVRLFFHLTVCRVLGWQVFRCPLSPVDIISCSSTPPPILSPNEQCVLVPKNPFKEAGGGSLGIN